MKRILVCDNKLCPNDNSQNLIKKLSELQHKKNNFEYSYCECIDFCDDGPNIMVFPTLKTYKKVTPNRLNDILENTAHDLEYSYDTLNKDEIKLYSTDPVHRRTIKLFRWHLAKELVITVENLKKSIKIFKSKYDVEEVSFNSSVKVALISTVKGPEMEFLIYNFGKEKSIERLENFLKKSTMKP